MDIILESANTPSQELHLLPCEIDHNGPAKVSSYFVQIPSADPATGKPCSTATFRGRQLYGTKNQLPTKYTGKDSQQKIKYTNYLEVWYLTMLDNRPCLQPAA